MFSSAYTGDAPWNDTHFHNDRFDKLLKQARAELEDSVRSQLYYECQQIVRDEGGVIVYVFRDNVEAASDKVRFGKVAGNWEADGAKAAERWWFA